MKPATELDLGDIVEILEGFTKKLPTMVLKDQIDLAARLQPAAKSIEAIDKAVKNTIKIKLKHNEGEVKGDLYKAVLKLVDIDRLEQKRLKDEKPSTYALFIRSDTDERVSFALR